MSHCKFDIEKIKEYYELKDSGVESSYVANFFCDKGNVENLELLMKKQWDDLFLKEEEPHKNYEHILHRIHNQINTYHTSHSGIISRNIFVGWVLKIASALFVPLALYFLIDINKSSSNENVSWVEINAPAWSRIQFNLPDGTSGWLNSNSTLKYYTEFKSDRQVYLTGEAFFNIYGDAKRPFKVIINGVHITALGTRFNVASYPDDNDIEIVLEEGKLAINKAEEKQSLLINPNDLLIYNKISQSYSVKKVNPQKYLSWTKGILIFRNDPLDVIARKLERWYNVDIDIVADNKEEIRLRATFTDESLEEILYFLKKSLPIDYTIEEGQLVGCNIYRKKKIKIINRNY